MSYTPPNPNGQASSSNSAPAVLSTEQEAKIDLLATKAKQDLLLAELELKANLDETQPVSVASLPLPTGSSTLVEQQSQTTKLTSLDANIGAQADSAASTDTGTFSIIAFIKRGLQNWTSLLSSISNIYNNLLKLLAVVDANNSTNVALGIGGTYTGTASQIDGRNTITVSCYTDQISTLTVSFSVDGTNWDSNLSFSIAVNTNEVHRFTVTKEYYRVTLANISGIDQTYLRLQTIKGNHPVLTSSLNSTIQSDADTTLVRPLDFNLMVSEGLYQNRTITIKDGINVDIDTGSTPEDVINQGGVYAGFPTGAVEAGEIVVAGADTGTVWYSYLASSTDTDYTFASRAITGAGSYSLGHNIWRCNFAYFVSSSPTTFNVGNITIRNTVTTANIFVVIETGFSQSFCSAYTVPFGSSVYLDSFRAGLKGSIAGSLDGYFWYRPLNESPRLRWPFEVQNGTLYFDEMDYTVRIPQQVDFIPRIITSSVNNLGIKVSYRLLKVK